MLIENGVHRGLRPGTQSLRTFEPVCTGRTQKSQILPVGGQHVVVLGRLDHLRNGGEALIIHQPTKWLGPERTRADVCVTVSSAAECTHRVVQVKELNALESDQVIELGENIVVVTDDVVARCPNVTRIHTHADAMRQLGSHPTYELCELAEFGSERSAGAGC